MGEKGFSLVELFVTTLLFLAVSFGLLPVLIGNLQLNADTRLRGEAVQVAAEIMARLQQTPFEDLAEETATILRNGHVFTCRIETVSSSDDDRRNVGLTITWSYRGQRHRYAVASVRLRNG